MFEESREFNHFHRRSQFVSPYFSKEGTLLTGNRTQYEQLSHRSLFKQPRKQSPASPFRPPGSTNILLPVRPSPEGVHLPQLTPSISMSNPIPATIPLQVPLASLKRTLSSSSHTIQYEHIHIQQEPRNRGQVSMCIQHKCATTEQSHCHQVNTCCGAT